MRLIDRLFGWREIRTYDAAATEILTDLLLYDGVSAVLASEGDGAIVRLGAKAAKKIAAALSEKSARFSIGPIRGVPALFCTALHRPGIVVGIVFSVLLLLLARGRVWEVRIAGDGSVDEDEIRAVLYDAGLRQGMRLGEVSPDAIASDCLLRSDLFSGMNVSLSGVVAHVGWIGRDGEANSVGQSDEIGVNLVASCDGVIVSVEPVRGIAAVAPGQTVHKGDLLVGGMYKVGAVRASGQVTAKVETVFSAVSPTTLTLKKTVKKSPVSFSVRLFGEKLFSLGREGDSVSVKELTLPGGVVLPFSFAVGYLHQTEEETVTLTEAQAAEKALRRLNWIVREALAEGELLKKEVTGEFSGGLYTATARTEYLINIAKPLAFKVKNEYNK